MMIKKDKLAEIDVLRAISALAVIAVHTTSSFVLIPLLNPLLLTVAYIGNLAGFAVPSFIFISGLVLYKNHSILTEKLSTFYKKRFYRVLPIYLLFSMFYLAVRIIANLVHGNDIQINPIEIIYKLVTGGAQYHLWYFGILFQLYLFYPLLIKLYNKYKIKFLIVSLIIQIIWSFVGNEVIKYSWLLVGQQNHKFPFFFSHIFWFVLGFYFLENREKISKAINIKVGVLLIILLNILRTAPLYFGLKQFTFNAIPEYYYYITTAINPLFFLIEILVLYKLSLIIIQKKNTITNALIKIGDYSLEIYLIHAFFISSLLVILARLSINYEMVLFYPILWVGTFALSFVFTYVYRKIKFTLTRFRIK